MKIRFLIQLDRLVSWAVAVLAENVARACTSRPGAQGGGRAGPALLFRAAARLHA
ncbi:hypothetical protein [Novosphingobium sp. ST904]|uniref:hypothetical protein n=1 Tax=Novosphingobium sp. ST904 TaxID=1684385 RepID=UPI000AEFA21E|nr:hypothetical protein [Novosphingobium sp. ST904]